LSAVILAGGQSRRMGRDKAWIELGGRSLLARARATIEPLDPVEIFVSGRPGEDYSALGCPVLYDLESGCGPLGGVERALAAAHAPLLLVLAVDLPQMTSIFLGRLRHACDALTGVVPEVAGALEPLAAIYPKRCHAFAREFLARQRRSAREFAQLCLAEGAVRRFPVPGAETGCLANWNCPEDLTGPGGSTGVRLVATDRPGLAQVKRLTRSRSGDVGRRKNFR